MTRVEDGTLHRLTLRLISEREVARRVARWKRRRVLKTPALWAVALFGAFLAWIGRER